MKLRAVELCFLFLLLGATAWAGNSGPEGPADGSSLSVTFPQVIRFSGTLSINGNSETVGVTFALYKEQTGGTPLWLETQNVQVDTAGRYSVLLGNTRPEGLPRDLFSSNEARWLGVRVENNPESARVPFVSVPYALKALDAETLAGKPASAYILQNDSNTSSVTANYASKTQTGTVAALTAGTSNYVAKFVNSTDLGNSAIYEDPSSQYIGFGTATPSEKLEINGNLVMKGQLTHQLSMVGQASAARLGQSFAGTFLTSDTEGKNIRFLTTAVGGTTTEQMTLGPTGRLGIGTTAPGERLEIKGNILLRGNEVHQIQVIGQQSSGRLGQALSGFFFASDTPGKRIGFYTTPTGGSLGVKMSILGDGRVGIGLTDPGSMLGVAGTIESTAGGFKFPDGTTLASATSLTSPAVYTATTTVDSQVVRATQNAAGSTTLQPAGITSGLRGDATATSLYATGVMGTSSSRLGMGVFGVNLSACDSSDPDKDHCPAYGVFGLSAQATHGIGVWGQADASAGTGIDNVGVFGFAKGDLGTGVWGLTPDTSAQGIGLLGETESTTGPTFSLYGVNHSNHGVGLQIDVEAQPNSNIIVGRSGSFATTSYNNVFLVASDGTVSGKVFNATGADFAESVDVNGATSQYHPGDVLMIDETGNRRLALSNEPYSTKVAGIYSTKPGVLASPHQIHDPKLADEVPLAIVGIVPCKVSTENGRIKAGDMLVSSSRPGYAMKGTDRQKMLGAIVGKALGSLDKDTGVIEVLVSLH